MGLDTGRLPQRLEASQQCTQAVNAKGLISAKGPINAKRLDDVRDLSLGANYFRANYFGANYL